MFLSQMSSCHIKESFCHISASGISMMWSQTENLELQKVFFVSFLRIFYTNNFSFVLSSSYFKGGFLLLPLPCFLAVCLFIFFVYMSVVFLCLRACFYVCLFFSFFLSLFYGQFLFLHLSTWQSY